MSTCARERAHLRSARAAAVAREARHPCRGESGWALHARTFGRDQHDRTGGGARDEARRARGQRCERARRADGVPRRTARRAAPPSPVIASYQIARRSSDRRRTRCTNGPPAAAMLRNRSSAASVQRLRSLLDQDVARGARVAAHRETGLGRAPELALLVAGRTGRAACTARSLAAVARATASGIAAATAALLERPGGHGLGHLDGRAEAIGGRLRERAQQRLVVRGAERRRAATVGGGGASPRCWPTRSGPRNGGRPVSASNSVAPSAYRSAAAPIGALLICSGDMYASVPRKPPDCVWPKSARCAPPKSPSFALPAASKKTLAGLTSRWTMPRSCAAPSAASRSSASRRAAAGVSGPSVASRSAERPARHQLEHEQPRRRLRVVTARRCSGGAAARPPRPRARSVDRPAVRDRRARRRAAAA